MEADNRGRLYFMPENGGPIVARTAIKKTICAIETFLGPTPQREIIQNTVPVVRIVSVLLFELPGLVWRYTYYATGTVCEKVTPPCGAGGVTANFSFCSEKLAYAGLIQC